MLGLGNSLINSGKIGPTIVRDGLVLQHNYQHRSVEPLSSGAAAINADADGADFIDVGLIPITTNHVTVSAWVYITDFINSCAIFSNRHGSSPHQGFAVRTATSPDKFQIITDEATTGSQTTSSSAKNTNQWYHVCAVLDRDGSQYLYVDGVLEGSTNISSLADSLTHTTSARIGKNFSDNEMNGYVCNVGYWNAALSQAQVKSIMNKNYDSLSASEKTDLVSWWNLDSVIPNTTTLVYDNHHGGEEILGADVIKDGDFPLPNVNWNLGTGITISGGSANFTGNSNANINQNAGLVTGTGYRTTFTISNYVSGDVDINVGGSTRQGSYAANGDYTVDEVSIGNILYFQENSSAGGFVGSISNVSVKEINGNTGTLS